MLYGAERQKRKADAKAEPLLISVFDPPEPSKHAKHRSGSGEKARVFERSEFRAAPIREEHRAPMRPHRIGMRPAKAVLVPFDATKGTRLHSRRKPLTLIPRPNKKARAINRL